MYTALYMAAIRTQIYLSAAQRRRLDDVAARRRTSMATVIREAVDQYLARDSQPDVDDALTQTFGAIPDLEVPPRSEWRANGQSPR